MSSEHPGTTDARRIALVIDYSLDYLGGAQSAFLDEAQLLLSRGHAVTIVAPCVRRGAEPEWSRRWRAAGGDLVLVPHLITIPGVDLPLVRNTAALRRHLMDALSSRQIEVVHTHSEFGLSAAAVSVARRIGLRTAQTVHPLLRCHRPKACGDDGGACGRDRLTRLLPLLLHPRCRIGRPAPCRSHPQAESADRPGSALVRQWPPIRLVQCRCQPRQPPQAHPCGVP